MSHEFPRQHTASSPLNKVRVAFADKSAATGSKWFMTLSTGDLACLESGFRPCASSPQTAREQDARLAIVVHVSESNDDELAEFLDYVRGDREDALDLVGPLLGALPDGELAGLLLHGEALGAALGDLGVGRLVGDLAAARGLGTELDGLAVGHGLVGRGDGLRGVSDGLAGVGRAPSRPERGQGSLPT